MGVHTSFKPKGTLSPFAAHCSTSCSTSCRGMLVASRARQRQLRRWYSLGVVVALLLGVYACWLLAGELVSLSRRLGLLAPPVS